MKWTRIVIIITVIGFLYGSIDTYINIAGYLNKIQPRKHEVELQEFIADLKNVPGVSPDFNPIITTEVKDFDFTMNFTLDKTSGYGVLNNSISGYDAGQYCLSSNPDGKAILKLIEFKLKDILSNNYNNQVIIKIKARGTADGIPVRSGSTYDGQIGDNLTIGYYRDNEPQKRRIATLINGKTKMVNEYFALLRAYDVVNEIKRLHFIDEKNIKIYVEEYKEIGDEFRRCDLSITLENAFLKDYNELNGISKFIIKKI